MRCRTRIALAAALATGLLAGPVVALADDTPPAAKPPRITIGTDPSEPLVPPLDLRAPALTQVFSPAALQLMLVEQEEANEDVPDVRVQSPRATPEVPRGMFRAIPWAITHPTQAWRVLAPLSD